MKERGIEGKGVRYRGGGMGCIEEEKGLTCEEKGYRRKGLRYRGGNKC